MAQAAVLERVPAVPVPEKEEPREPEPFCCRCKEDFPVAPEPSRWAMGMMRLLARAPQEIQNQFRDWLVHPQGKYLCGNCYFDLTD